MHAGYADTAARMPSHGDFLRMTAPSPLAPARAARGGQDGFDFARTSGTVQSKAPLL